MNDSTSLPKATVGDASQDWAEMDGVTAWHLIDRHADNWGDIAKMMDELIAAKVGAERERCAKLADQMDCGMRCGVGSEVGAAIRKG